MSWKCYLCDLDGTVFVGNNPLEKNLRFMNDRLHDSEVYFITNNTSKLPEDYQKKLANFGVEVPLERIQTPLSAMISYLRKNEINNFYPIATKQTCDKLLKELPHSKIETNPELCEAVLITYDIELSYEKLVNASKILQKSPKTKLFATHSDLVCPTEFGFIPDAGSILQMLKTATDRDVDFVFGKPNPIFVNHLINEFKNKDVVMIGDRLYTDYQLAKNINSDFICVLSGETKLEQAEQIKDSRFHYVNHLGEL